MSATVDIANHVRSFKIEIPEEQIDDLRRRIAATRWPTREPGPRQSRDKR
jgi:hypothetical protein